MISPSSLSCLLLLHLGTCFPQLGREEPTDATGGIEDQGSWPNPAGGRQIRFLRDSSQWLRAPNPHALLVVAKELQMSDRERAGFRFRFGRQDDGGSEATGFLPADGEKADGPLGALAEELNGHSRKKGGFSFRFGRR
ncbi:hypothetical protein MC885_011724 [Smutsia gigantea]|nr:hypothetical protein MC885_011724 [Smutsia gigantea]